MIAVLCAITALCTPPKAADMSLCQTKNTATFAPLGLKTPTEKK